MLVYRATSDCNGRCKMYTRFGLQS
jgi:hypothetical protein